MSRHIKWASAIRLRQRRTASSRKRIFNHQLLVNGAFLPVSQLRALLQRSRDEAERLERVQFELQGGFQHVAHGSLHLPTLEGHVVQAGLPPSSSQEGS